jgi:hypothetical protein
MQSKGSRRATCSKDKTHTLRSLLTAAAPARPASKSADWDISRAETQTRHGATIRTPGSRVANRLQQQRVSGICIIHPALAKTPTNTLLHLLTSIVFDTGPCLAGDYCLVEQLCCPSGSDASECAFNHSVTLPPTYSASTPTLPITSQSKTDTAIVSSFTTATMTEAGGAATGAANSNNVMDANMGLFYSLLAFVFNLI